MQIAEQHKLFRVLWDKIDSKSTPEYVPEAIDVLFNKKQNDLIEMIGEKKGIERTQILTDYLAPITEKTIVSTFTNDQFNKPYGIYVQLPDNYKIAILEEADVKVPDCGNITEIIENIEYIVDSGSIVYNTVTLTSPQTFTGVVNQKGFYGTGTVKKVNTVRVRVIPLTRDSYSMSVINPFKEPNEDEIFRIAHPKDLTTGKLRYELILNKNMVLSKYYLDYIRVPNFMKYGTNYATVSTDIDCELSESGTYKLTDMTVQTAMGTLSDERYQILENELKK